MRIWLHTKTVETGDLLGFADIRPDSVAEQLIIDGFADPVNSGNQTTPSSEAKWAGTSAALDAGAAPAVTTAPVITGAASVGATLTCTPGVYSGVPSPTVTRQWKRSGSINISGETGLTYVTQVADTGANITVEETATNSEGSVQSVSNAIYVV